jgi:hypothetical protein
MKNLFLSIVLLASVISHAKASKPLSVPEACWDNSASSRVVDGSFIFMIDTADLATKEDVIDFIDKTDDLSLFIRETLIVNHDYIMVAVKPAPFEKADRAQTMRKINQLVKSLQHDFPKMDVSCNGISHTQPGVSVGN